MSKIILFLALILSSSLFANKPPSEIYQNVLKLHSLKRVLYIAAHPDDENTRALAYFSLGENAATAYLSLTRGDGGQNLIGEELSEDLGVLRTQELLAARSFDKAIQYFSRAVDFGYSKSAEESFEKWGKDALLSDVVLVIRKFKPDVIITRFPPDERGGHGHHTASAILAIEAFKKAADPNFLPNQVKEYGVWKTTSIYWNSSSWWDENLAEKAKNNENYIVKDIGGYNQFLGKSYNEIGTIARSQHKCQGFGAIIERGSRLEYFEYLEGEKLKNDFFENNSNSWTKLIDQNFQKGIDEIVAHFDFTNPSKNIKPLLALRKRMLDLKDSELKAEKISMIDQIIFDCLGLYVECIATDYAKDQKSTMKVKVNMINRSNNLVVFKGTDIDVTQKSADTLKMNQEFSTEFELPETELLSNPYWLQKEFENLFVVENPDDLGEADSKPTFLPIIHISIEGENIGFACPITYKWSDPSYGERRRNLISTPAYSANFEQQLSIVKLGEEKTIKVKIHGFADSLDTKIIVKAPLDWEISPKEISLKTTRKHEEVFAEITLKANEKSSRGKLILEDANGKQLYAYTEIAYDHIPTQAIFKKTELECIKLDAKINSGKIAYISGVKDAVPNGIRELGFELEEFEVSALSNLDLNQFKTVVLGIRVYNVHQELKNFDQKLFDYVEQGGKVIMQYNTASRWVTSVEYGPLPFKIGRNRVTEEDATVEFLDKKHPILNTPNQITQADFENWVQERGLYFAENWDENYNAILSWHDKGEEAQKGALIVLEHGKGQFIYTGISFFRELPNGVEGAFKLFANLLSY